MDIVPLTIPIVLEFCPAAPLQSILEMAYDATNYDDSTSLLEEARDFLERIQLALAKRHFTYNFEFLRRQYRAHPNRNSLIILPRFHHRARTMLKSPIKESNNGLPCKRHYEFISWKPVIQKSPIDFNHPTLLIKLIRITGFRHPQPENTQAKCVNNASCLKIANK